MVSNRILKENARNQLGGGIFKTNWLMLILVLFIQGALISAASTVGMGIANVLIAGTLAYGVARISLSLIRGANEINLSDLFCGFKENWVQSFVLGFLQSLFIILWSLLFVIPGIIKSYSYSLASYIQQDEEDKDWERCLNKSQEMMKGHKWQMFCLDLSFIGWYILGALCFGIGTIFVTPYHQMAKANFYEALRATYTA